MMRKILLFASALIAGNCLAQGPVEESTIKIPRTVKDETQLPSPEASQMNRYVDYPVDYSTGVASVGIPLYEVQVGNYSLPISLSYHTSGIKVDDEDCMVGLGWTLSAGGNITRVIHGRPDEQTTFCIKNHNTIQSDNDTTYLQNVLHRQIDAQYDRYYYHLPGYSGSFIIMNGTIVQLPPTDLTIEFCDTMSNGVRNFLITTPDGCRYHFASREQTVYTYSPDVLTTVAGYVSPNYTAVTGWHLTDIVTTSRTDTIRFNYTTTSHTRYEFEDKLYSRSFTVNGNQVTQTGYSDVQCSSSSVLNYPDKHLPSSISCRTCTVKFTSVPKQGPTDFAHLSGIHVVSPASDTVRTICMSTSTFPSGKIRLDSVTVRSDGILLDRHSFTYYAGNNSKDKDFFGYNNHVSGSNDRSYNSILDSNGELSANRAYLFSSARGCALNTVTDATGAVTTYEYEANTCEQDDHDISIGLRLNRITVSDPVTGRSRQRQFTYENGQSTIDFTALGTNSFITVSGLIKQIDLNHHTYSTGSSFTSSCRTPGAQAENAVIHYGRVTETVTGTGISHPVKTVYEFDLTDIGHPYISNGGTNLPDMSLNANNEHYLGSKIYYGSTPEVNQRVYSSNFLYGHFRETCWEKAPLVRKTTYLHDGTDYRLQEEQVNSYTLKTGTPFNIGFYVAPTTRNTRSFADIQTKEVLHTMQDFNFFETTAQRGRLYKDSTTVVRYYDNVPSQPITTVYSYNDHKNSEEITLPFFPRDNTSSNSPRSNPVHIYPHVEGFDADSLCDSYTGLLQSVKVRQGDRTLNRYYCYADNISSLFFRALSDSGYIALPVMEKIVADGTDTLLIHNTYKAFLPAANIQLSRRTLLHNGTEFYTRDYHDYDTRGNIRSTSANGGLPVSYIWDNTLQQPVAAVQGRHGATLVNAFGPVEVDSIMPVSYSYRPLVGCTYISQPDWKGRHFTYSGSRLATKTSLSGETAERYSFSLYGEDGLNATGQTIYTEADEGAGITTRIFYDGWGLPVNTVAKGVTPAHRDLVSLTTYDALGRKTEEWLSTPMSSVSSVVGRSDFSSSSASFYRDSYPYQTFTYEESPASELLSTAPAGNGFRAHPQTRQLRSNQSSNDLYSCLRFRLTGDYSFAADGCYPAGELQVERIADSDQRTTLVFTDYRGMKVLERQIIGEDEEEWNDTYYIHDALGDVRFVLPPLLYGMETVSGNAWDIRSNASLRKYAYFYRYDERRDLVEKKLPGAEPVYMVYDRTHALILSQDGNRRADNQWTFSLPDRFGRPAVEGLCTLPDTAALKGSWVRASLPDYAGYSTTLCQTGYRSNVTFPSAQLLQAHYYDTHRFKTLPAFAAKFTILPTDTTTYQFTPNPSDGKRSYRGLATGTMTAVLPSGTPLLSVTYYDDEDRPYLTMQTNVRGGVDIDSTVYSLDGRPLTRILRHDHNSSALTQVGADLETYNYTYDHAGRLLTTTHQLRGQTARTMSSYTYNELGRPYTHSQGNGITTSYGYNLHGWLTSIVSSKFSQYLYYEQVHNGSSPQYGGNISAMDWKNTNTTRFGYTFDYDRLSRLQDATYYQNASNNNYYSTHYTYDPMGNILSLWRRGKQSSTAYACIDSLSFIYDGNQLKKVTDAGNDPVSSSGFDFVDGADVATEYSYDANGNMTSDLNKYLDVISYNVLNLPQSIEYKGRNSADYLYAADGRKLSTTYTLNTRSVVSPDAEESGDSRALVSLVLDYCSNIHYQNSTPSRLDIDGGYITVESSIPAYHYYALDYQGNVRVVSQNSLNTGQVNSYYPFGGLHDSSTNGDVNAYKYNGKELDRALGLNLYDYHARQYDAALGRFTTMDPMAEKYYSISPYAYCGNNPVNAVDPTGEDYEITIDSENMTITVSATYYAFEDDMKVLNEGIAHWNETSGKYSVGGYVVNFNLQSQPIPLCNLKGTTKKDYFIQLIRKSENVEPKFGTHNNFFYQGEVDKPSHDGETRFRRLITLSSNSSGNDVSTAHEIGHTLGLGHSNGIMTKALDIMTTSEINGDHVQSIIKRVFKRGDEFPYDWEHGIGFQTNSPPVKKLTNYNLIKLK